MKKLYLSVSLGLAFLGSTFPISANSLCEQGSGLKNFTVRSFEGQLCKISLIAAWAEKYCKITPGYMESKCHKIAEKTLSNTNLISLITGTQGNEQSISEILAKNPSRLSQIDQQFLNKFSINVPNTNQATLAKTSPSVEVENFPTKNPSPSSAQLSIQGKLPTFEEVFNILNHQRTFTILKSSKTTSFTVYEKDEIKKATAFLFEKLIDPEKSKGQNLDLIKENIKTVKQFFKQKFEPQSSQGDWYSFIEDMNKVLEIQEPESKNKWLKYFRDYMNCIKNEPEAGCRKTYF